MTFSEDDWLRYLVAMGVRSATAEEWVTAFAEEVQPELFDEGEKEFICFVPQVLYEYSLLEKREESLVYTAERIQKIWPSRFKTVASASLYAFAPKRLANFVYAERHGNGAEASGDGYRYRGRPSLAGRLTYARVGQIIQVNLEEYPERMMEPRVGLLALRIWWEELDRDIHLCDQAKLRRWAQDGEGSQTHCAALQSKFLEVLP